MDKIIEQEGMTQVNSGIKSMVFVGFFIALILGFVFVYRPLSAELKNLEDEIVVNQVDLADLNTQLFDFQADEADYMNYTDVSLKKLENLLPRGVSQDGVISDLTVLAKNFNLNLNSLSFSKGGELIGGVNILKINTSFEGDFRDLVKFLEGIEQNARKISVNSISVQVSDVSVGGIKRANFSLSLDTYYLPLK